MFIFPYIIKTTKYHVLSFWEPPLRLRFPLIGLIASGRMTAP